MKKAFLLLFVIALSTKLTKAQTDWKSYKIDDKISIKLPIEPERKDEKNLSVVTKDSSAYFITIIDMGVDTAKASEIINKPDFAEGLKNAMLEKNPGFTVSEMKRGSWKNYHIFHAEGANTLSHLKVYFYMLSIGSRLYLMGDIVPDNKSIDTNFSDLLSLN